MSKILINDKIYDLSIPYFRRELYMLLDSLLDEVYNGDYDYEEIEQFENEVSQVKNLIKNEDVQGLLKLSSVCSPSYECMVFEQEPLYIIDVLKHLGYKVEKSSVSNSIYVTVGQDDEGYPLQLRISDHRRPNYEYNSSYYVHNYYQEYITDKPYLTGKELIKLGFLVEEKEKYYFW